MFVQCLAVSGTRITIIKSIAAENKLITALLFLSVSS